MLDLIHMIGAKGGRGGLVLDDDHDHATLPECAKTVAPAHRGRTPESYNALRSAAARANAARRESSIMRHREALRRLGKPSTHYAVAIEAGTSPRTAAHMLARMPDIHKAEQRTAAGAWANLYWFEPIGQGDVRSIRPHLAVLKALGQAGPDAWASQLATIMGVTERTARKRLRAAESDGYVTHSWHVFGHCRRKAYNIAPFGGEA